MSYMYTPIRRHVGLEYLEGVVFGFPRMDHYRFLKLDRFDDLKGEDVSLDVWRGSVLLII